MDEFVPVTKLVNDRENEIPIHSVKSFGKIQRNDSQLFLKYIRHISYDTWLKVCVI